MLFVFLWISVRLCALGQASNLIICYARQCSATRDPFQYPLRQTSYRKISNQQDWVLECCYRFEIWQAIRQLCCRDACQISKRLENYDHRSRALRNLTITRLIWCDSLRPEQNGCHFADGIHNAFSWMKAIVYQSKFPWCLFPVVQMTLSQPRFG